MPIELFRAAVTRPDAIFCDSSFILDVLTHEVPTVAATITDLDPNKQARAAEAASFFHEYSSAGTQFVSSPYTLQEIGFVLGKYVLRKAKPVFKKGKLNQTWGNLKLASYPTFVTLRAEVESVIQDAWTRFQAHGIWFVVPNDGDETAYGITVGSEVIEAAFLLLKRYEAIDPMDAFHIAMGMACGLEWFVTTDQGWKDVTVINVFCDR